MSDTNIETETKLSEGPLVFISHDSRDADLAEAFSKLLKSVSAGMLKSFRSSDKKGNEGIEFGDEWYKTLMAKLDVASDVVCLLTERSLDRPWILYEAGVAKGKLGTPVHGVAIGVPLSKVSSGPFYQFQNSDDSEDSLSKLVLQLCRRIQGLEPDKDVIVNQVAAFKKSATETLKSLGGQKVEKAKEITDEGAIAKVLEEMKLIVRELPLRIEQQLADSPEQTRSRRISYKRAFSAIEELSYRTSKRGDDPIILLLISSLVRDDFPWLYELGIDAYRTVKSGNSSKAHEALVAFRNTADATIRGPFLEDLGIRSKDAYMMLRELPMMIDHYAHRLEEKPAKKRTKAKTNKEESSN